ncbi:hypothetical protein [Pseudothauera rhizosphaerae]|uniref:Uncharacterized protein n=1 Tax=Pseudothauera rhizosphaerae TaxID=2565932 RepID=A0A4S4AMJ7_9RHOO|nr:hypothetical protein [Pseudothauera rhizosphaerae]THF60810.1 hypothetical protein E6O51_11225 [Pseudothauera rhizosphaerae]
MADALRLQFKPDTDGTGELFAEVLSNGFAGAASARFSESGLVELAKKLATAFPLPADPPLGIRGGYWSKSGEGLEQEHVGLTFYPVGSLGRVGCRVVLSTPVHQHNRPEGQSSLAVDLLTTYESLGAFSRSLELLATGGVNEAVLEAAG